LLRWKRWFVDNADLIIPVRTLADIRRAKEEGKTGIILGFQNTSAVEDQVGYIQLFKELGVGIVQITYNTQNLVGAGCYEPRDSGLSGFGHEVVAEMNRVGILCDLSHVGAVTSRDVILASKRPTAYTHILPAALKPHPRNKSDEEIRFIVEHGGFVGVTMFPPFLARGNASTVEDYVAAIDYVIRIAGEDSVGIGTDFTQDQDDAFFEYICHDKGYGWRVTGPLGDVVNPAGLRTIGDFPNLTSAMEKAGWPETKIRKIMGENWLRLLAEVWGE
jgi:membrane dipeptidase